MNRFNYIIDKIQEAEFDSSPFKHLWIADLFNTEDFNEIVNLPEIKLKTCSSDSELFRTLFENGYRMIGFPGCTLDKDYYMKWHQDKSSYRSHNNDTCEGFGVTLRLHQYASPILKALTDFISGPEFNRALAEKFGIGFEECIVDNGVQKYLDGYEISPHPDIRRKAATFMININPSVESEKSDHHTHYLSFQPGYSYVESFWRFNPHVERCWVPWDWCKSEKQQTQNNSLVAFSPSSNTMHAVKANYDHLPAQRTQIYGNLWFQDTPSLLDVDWKGLNIQSHVVQPKKLGRLGKVKGSLRAFKNRLLRGRRSDSGEIGGRNI